MALIVDSAAYELRADIYECFLVTAQLKSLVGCIWHNNPESGL